MKRFYSIFLSLLCFAVSSLSAQTIKGVLYDESNGEAIPFANVVLDGTKHGAATDLNGFFLINKLPAGTYILKVRYVGYEEYSEEITLAKNQVVTKNIQLKPTAAILKEVIITDNRAEERKMQTQDRKL